MVIYLIKGEMSRYTVIAILSATKVVTTLFKESRGDTTMITSWSE